jgi:hypothetical protein
MTAVPVTGDDRVGLPLPRDREWTVDDLETLPGDGLQYELFDGRSFQPDVLVVGRDRTADTKTFHPTSRWNRSTAGTATWRGRSAPRWSGWRGRARSTCARPRSRRVSVPVRRG